MPIFDFICNNCGQSFDVMIKNKEKDSVLCPECQSKDVKQQLSIFYSSAEKTPARQAMPASCEGCSAKG